MPNDTKDNALTDFARDALRAQSGDKQQQPERSVAEVAQARDAAPARQQGASPDPANLDRLADKVRNEWGIGKGGKHQDAAEHAQGPDAGDRSQRKTAHVSRSERGQGVHQETNVNVNVNVGGNSKSTQRPGAWDQFAKGTRSALSDFVSRVLWQERGDVHEPAHAHEPGHAQAKGMDR